MPCSHHVLLVEDDAALRLLCKVNLELDGFVVSEAGRLDEARAAIAAGDIDAVLLDVRLGSESGLDLLAELRAARPPLPVVLLTGGTPLEPATLDGVAAVVTKPFDVTELGRCVLGVLR